MPYLEVDGLFPLHCLLEWDAVYGTVTIFSNSDSTRINGSGLTRGRWGALQDGDELELEVGDKLITRVMLPALPAQGGTHHVHLMMPSSRDTACTPNPSVPVIRLCIRAAHLPAFPEPA